MRLCALCPENYDSCLWGQLCENALFKVITVSPAQTGFLAAPQIASIIVQLSHLFPEPFEMRAAVDYFIDMGFSLEHALDRYTKPAETMLLSLLKENMPSVYNYGANLLASSPSIHAAKLPLMNPFHAVVLILAYYAVISSGMWVMKNIVKQKFHLKTFSNIHNAFLVWLSGYMCLNIAYQALVVRGYSVFNNDFDDVPESFPLAKHLWLFYFSKIFEFVDTCIMVGKMNFRQVSFLHVYHHSSILAVWWLTIYVCPHTECKFDSHLAHLF